MIALQKIAFALRSDPRRHCERHAGQFAPYDKAYDADPMRWGGPTEIVPSSAFTSASNTPYVGKPYQAWNQVKTRQVWGTALFEGARWGVLGACVGGLVGWCLGSGVLSCAALGLMAAPLSCGLKVGIAYGRNLLTCVGAREDDMELMRRSGTPSAMRNEAERNFIEQRPAQDPFGDLIRSWNQGSSPNCYAIAVIKAAMDRYGETAVDARRDANGWDVRMQDGFRLNVTYQEVEAANADAKLEVHPRLADAWGIDAPKNSGEQKEWSERAYGSHGYGVLLLACMSKRASLESGQPFEAALHDVNHGTSFFDRARQLGLYEKLVLLDAETLDGQDSVVALGAEPSAGHAVFVNRLSDGRHVMDKWGVPALYRGRVPTSSSQGGWVPAQVAFTFRP